MKRLLLILTTIALVGCSEDKSTLGVDSYAVVVKINNYEDGLCDYTIRHVRIGYSNNYSYEQHPCDWHMVGDTIYSNPIP